MSKATVLNQTTMTAATHGQINGARTDTGTFVSSTDNVVVDGKPNSGSFSRAIRGVSTWGFFDQAIVSLTSFLIAASIGRVCGSAELGIYSLAIRVFWLAVGIPNALIWMPYTSRAPRLTENRRRYFLGSTTVHLGFLAAISTATLLVVSATPSLDLSQKTWLMPMCLALVPFSILMMFKEHLRRILLAHMETVNLLLVDVPIAVCQLSILALLVWTQQLSAVTALVGAGVGCLWAILWVVYHRDRFRVARRRVEMHWAHNFQFGKWLTVVAVAWLLGDASYYWLLESFHGLTVMGQFSAAAITVMFFNPIMLTVQNLARSILSNSYASGGQADLWQQAVKGTRYVALGFGVLFLLLAIFGGQLVTLIFGAEFQNLDYVVATLCLGMYMHVLNSPVEAALNTIQAGRVLLAASLVRLGLIFLVGVPLIFFYGPISVGITMAISSRGAGITQWFYFRRRCRDAG